MTDPVIPTPITELPPAPLVTDTPEQFDDKAFPFTAALDGMRDGMNSAASAAYQNAIAADERAVAAQAAQDFATTEANRATAQADAAMGYRDTASTHAATATTQAGIATTQAGAASSAQTAAQLSAAAAAIDAQRAEDAAAGISDGPVTSVNGKTGVVSLAATDIAPAATPQEMLAGTETAYRSMSPALAAMAGRVVRDARTAAVVLTSADKGKLIDITAGTFIQTFDAAATFVDGWWCYIRNSGTGDITLDPSDSETIDGLTSYVMYPGECRLVQCDGEMLRTIVLNAFAATFISSGTFVKPPGYPIFNGLLWSGGGGGNASLSGGGGGGGGGFPFSIPAEKLLATQPVVIGSGGAVSGGGGASSFAGIMVSGGDPGSSGFPSGGGGVSGLQGVPSSGGFAGGSGSGATVYGGASGGVGFGSSSVYGGGGGGGGGGSGGASVYGGNGGNGGNAAGGGRPGVAPAGGGGSTQPGARGELRIWGII